MISTAPLSGDESALSGIIDIDSPRGKKLLANLLSVHKIRGGGNIADTLGGVITGGSAIGVSRTAKESRTKLDRMGASVLGVTVSNKKGGKGGKWGSIFPVRIRTKSDRSKMVASAEFGFGENRPPIDKHFAIRVIGGDRKYGKRGRGIQGLSARIGNKTVVFPYAYMLHGRAIEWSIRKNQEFRLRLWNPQYYINKAGGLSAIEEYSKKRLEINTKDGIGFVLSKLMKKYRGNG